MTFHVVTFYQIAYVKNPMKLSREVERISTKEGLSGTFFSTPQGVNATLCGSLEGLNQIVHLLQNSYALNITPAWSAAKKNPFKRFKVKLKDKLLPLEGDFDPVISRGKHISPDDWNELISDPDTTVVDVRNNYESNIGSFKNSLIDL